MIGVHWLFSSNPPSRNTPRCDWSGSRLSAAKQLLSHSQQDPTNVWYGLLKPLNGNTNPVPGQKHWLAQRRSVVKLPSHSQSGRRLRVSRCADIASCLLPWICPPPLTPLSGHGILCEDCNHGHHRMANLFSSHTLKPLFTPLVTSPFLHPQLLPLPPTPNHVKIHMPLGVKMANAVCMIFTRA